MKHRSVSLLATATNSDSKVVTPCSSHVFPNSAKERFRIRKTWIYITSVRADLRMRQSSPSLSLVDEFPFIEPQTCASSDHGGDLLNAPVMWSFIVIEPGSTIISPPASLPTSFISPVAALLQTSSIVTLPPPRQVCTACSETFDWAQVIQRHAKKHNPHAQRFDCPFPGCPYTGLKVF